MSGKRIAGRGVFRRGSRERAAYALYGAVVEQARQPDFYHHCGVPDDLDGRFDLIVLHAFLLLHRLRGEGPPGRRLAGRLIEILFDDMDRNLREMGVGDLGVGKRVKAMARAFYGRLGAYDRALGAPGDGELNAALRRNLYGMHPVDGHTVLRAARYVRRAARHLAAQPGAEVLAGRASFPVLGGVDP